MHYNVNRVCIGAQFSLFDAIPIIFANKGNNQTSDWHGMATFTFMDEPSIVTYNVIETINLIRRELSSILENVCH